MKEPFRLRPERCRPLPNSKLQVLPLPWLPASISDGAPVAVPVRATHRLPVDDFRADPDDS